MVGEGTEGEAGEEAGAERGGACEGDAGVEGDVEEEEAEGRMLLAMEKVACL